MSIAKSGSIVLPMYESGKYYATHAEPEQDDSFKADAFLNLWKRIEARHLPVVSSYADVGCGGGGAAQRIVAGLRSSGYHLHEADGYDISPHVLALEQPDVRFHMADFCATNKRYSLTTLFDVVEHVPDPLGFLRSTAERCDFVALHIPLDRTMVNCLFDRFHHRLRYPGHISIFDAPSALNLLTTAGITPIDYSYTHGYAAPSGTMTWLQKAMFPIRYGFAHVSPWLASRTFGGISLMVFGATRTGLTKMAF